MIRVQRYAKGRRAKKRIEELLEKLREGSVIVEGAHDVKVMAKLGVTAIPYSKVVSLHGTGVDLKKSVYLLTDSDRGGEEKKEKLKSALLTLDSGCKINEDIGRHLLKMLNATSVEQIYGPILRIIEEGEEEKRR